MYKETVLEALRNCPTKDQIGIGKWITEALNGAGHSNLFCLGIWNGGENEFEGVIMDGDGGAPGPLMRWIYNWDTDELEVLEN